MTASGMLTEADIKNVVEVFYAEVRDDELLGPVFTSKIQDHDWQTHLDNICNFWSSIFLKTKRFDGNPMRKHLGIEQITPEHFIKWLSLFRETVDQELNAEKANQMHEMAERIGKSLQMGLAFYHGKNSKGENPFKAYGLRRSHNNIIGKQS